MVRTMVDRIMRDKEVEELKKQERVALENEQW